jgi:hypothetical protein
MPPYLHVDSAMAKSVVQKSKGRVGVTHPVSGGISAIRDVRPIFAPDGRRGRAHPRQRRLAEGAQGHACPVDRDFKRFGIAAVVALKYPLVGLGMCILCLIVYLKPEDIVL